MAHTTYRLWWSAILSWLAMLGLTAFAVGSGLWPRAIGDPEIRGGHLELAALDIVVMAAPLFLICFCVFRPFMVIAVRREVWRPGRVWNSLMGITLVVPAFMVIALVGRIAGWGHRGGPLPLDFVILIAFGGLIFGATMPANVAPPTQPLNK